MARAPLTRGQKALLGQTRETLRRLSSVEKAARGLSAGGAYYVDATKRYTKASPVVTVSRWRDAREGPGRSHGVLSKLRAQGLAGYKTAASEEQAKRQRASRSGENELRNRLRVGAQWFHHTIDKRTGAVVRQGRGHRLTAEQRDRFFELRRMKIGRREWIEDGGDWHMAIDIAQSFNDPTINHWMQS